MNPQQDSPCQPIGGALTGLSRLLDAKATWLKPVAPLAIPEPLPQPQPAIDRSDRLDNWARRWREGRTTEDPPPPHRLWGLCCLLVLATAVWLCVWHFGQPGNNSAADSSAYFDADAAVTIFDPNLDFQEAIRQLEAAPKNPHGGRNPSLVGSPPPSSGLGTKVDFLGTMTEAALRAQEQRKLMLVLNVSGDFEDARFTWNNAEALRVNALANEQVGTFANSHFVSSYVKVGTFALVNGKKQGGNVASYFCLPSGRVLHALAGPVDAGTFLQEARWVVNVHKAAFLEGRSDLARYQAIVLQAHTERFERDFGVRQGHIQQFHRAAAKLPADESRGPLGERNDAPTLGKLHVLESQRGLTNAGRVHLLLALFPLVKIEDVYKYVFEQILNEKLSLLPVAEK